MERFLYLLIHWVSFDLLNTFPLAVADLRGGAMQFSGKNWPNNRYARPP